MQGVRQSSVVSTMSLHGLHLASESERGILARRRHLLRHNLRKQLDVIKADAYEKGSLPCGLLIHAINAFRH